MGIFGRIAEMFKQYEPTQEEIEVFEAQKIQNNITKDTKDYDFDNLSISYSWAIDEYCLREIYEPIPIDFYVKIKSLEMKTITYEISFVGSIDFMNLIKKNNENLINDIKNILLEHNFLGFKKNKIWDYSTAHRFNVKSIGLEINEQYIYFDNSDYCYGEFDILYQKLEDILETEYYFGKILLPFLKF